MRRYAKDSYFLFAAITLLLVCLVWLRSYPPVHTKTLRMTAGNASGLRHQFAMELSRECAKVGVSIDVQATEGSEVALKKLKLGEIDIALVQGGLVIEDSAAIRQVCALHIEPLHLLVKPKLKEAIDSAGLGALAGHCINLGPLGSGTHALAREVLEFAGLNAANPSNEASYFPDLLSYSHLMQMDSDDLPDAVFSVSSLPSPIADFMIERHAFRLVPLTFGEALSLQAFTELGQPLDFGSIDKRHVYSTTIPSQTYSIRLSEPPEALKTLGTRLLLVAHERVDGESIKRLLDLLSHSNITQSILPALDVGLLDLPSEFRLHAGAELYRKRNKPIIAGDAIDYLEKVLAIAATVAGGAFFLAQWYVRRNRRKREASLLTYIERVITIERECLHNEMSVQLDLAELIRLQCELAELKSEAVRKFASGELEGESLIQGFLSLVNDARNQLTRLILHQRDNIEQLSSQQKRNTDELWIEQSRFPGVVAPASCETKH